MSTVRDEKKLDPKDGSNPQTKRAPTTFDGKIVSIKGDTLVMQNKEGRNFSHTLAKNVKVSCDGTACDVDELRVGSAIRVTTQPDDQDMVTCVESLDENKEFAKCH